MAVRLDVSQSAISQYERGAIQPGIKQAKRLVAIASQSGLSVSLDQVYEQAEVSSGLPLQDSSRVQP